MPPLRSELELRLRELIRTHHLTAAEDPVVSAASECITLFCGDEEGWGDVGTCRIGGVPDLPEGVEWPRTEGGSLCFVAQFNLAELPELTEHPLPTSGMLYFFVGDDEPATDVHSRWMYHPGPASRLPAERVPPPEEQANEYYAELTPFRLEPRLTVSLPDIACEGYPDIEELCETDKDDDPGDRYLELTDDITGGDSSVIGRLFGHPQAISSDPRKEAYLVRSGRKHMIYSSHLTPEAAQKRIDDAWGNNPLGAQTLLDQMPDILWLHEHRDEVEAAVSKWRSLLTLHSSRAVGLTIWDAGFFGNLIDTDDLAKLDFSRVYTRVHSS
ncbi:MAG: DUF1963 domain-containing protein [Planctomycetia bacterium]|nr:DUF1963 domain-containing protein [Planctomycetia bacterium]